ncbi:PREDICTED: vomeronasal type-2 receptor 26-like, partial [Nanorana parkeri]|uniref:vomeronasal type-2 receptor 26-like n=1 Tax=Nanorana parkeri TaxID=125878 RepID=UPI0008548AC2
MFTIVIGTILYYPRQYTLQKCEVVLVRDINVSKCQNLRAYSPFQEQDPALFSHMLVQKRPGYFTRDEDTNSPGSFVRDIHPFYIGGEDFESRHDLVAGARGKREGGRELGGSRNRWIVKTARCVLKINGLMRLEIFVLPNFSTPIVRANNRNLSFILLFSLMLSFLSVFLFIGHPVDITCMLQQVVFGIVFTVSLSSILAKTIMVFIAFKATRPGSSCRKLVGVKLPNTVLLLCSLIQVMIAVFWLSISPPFQEYDMHSSAGKIIIQCNEGSVVGFYSVLGYMGLLAAVSFVLAFMVRTLPDSFNEAKYI